ncbi:MAG: copper chaperone PCu(A)C [Ilumatobacter sp.]|uniref:copper chaperone PCu(A)C n=1 Tax=Ilumatobacter sp. TaxID=1967498 RepID=UPI003299A737
MKHLRISTSLPIALLAAITLAACGSDSNSTDTGPATSESAVDDASPATLTVSDAWSREPAEGQDVGVVYGTVTNPGDADVRILRATSSVSSDVELHETTVSDSGAMSMREVEEGYVVPAGGQFVFEPGGPHIMLLDIDSATFPTDQVEVTLEIEGDDPVSFSAPVRAIGDDMEGMDDMEDTDHSDVEDTDHSEMDGMEG